MLVNVIYRKNYCKELRFIKPYGTTGDFVKITIKNVYYFVRRKHV